MSNNLTECQRFDDQEDWFEKIPLVKGLTHFNNLQSSNWNSMRLKPPPTEDSQIGWRVEFRPMDIQLTDFENAALTVFLGLIVNVVNLFSINLLMPIPLVDENMELAHKRNSLLDSKFWFRLVSPNNYQKSDVLETDFLQSDKNFVEANEEDKFGQLYIWQILEGDAEAGFPKGLIPLCQEVMV